MKNAKSALNTLAIIVCLFVMYKWWTAWRFSPEERAYNAVKEYVTETLKSPSSAEFPTTPYKIDASNGVHTVIYGSVEALNPLGVKVKSYYRAEVERREYGRYWEVVKLEQDYSPL